MQQGKQRVIIFLCMIMLMSLLAACGGNNNKAGSDAGSKTNQPGNNVGKASESPEPAKVSMLISDHSQPVPGGNPMNDPTIKYLGEKTNTILDIEFLPHGDYMNTLLVKYSGGSLPDIIQEWGVSGTLHKNGKLLPLNDLIDQYGPNLKKNIPQESWDAVTINGKIYGIPQTPNGNTATGRVIYVRKDWMDKAGITKLPATPDEYLDMLRAFKTGDPNGNNKQDEIPFAAREDFTWIENIFGMFGVSYRNWIEQDGKLVPAFTTDQFKKAIAYMAVMYKEGLLDSEFLINKPNVWQQKIQNDMVGSWNHVTGYDWQTKLNESISDKKPVVMAIPTPRDPEWDGEVGFVQTPAVKVFNITTEAENPEAIIKMFDWLASEEGQAFVVLGLEGDTYTVENGVYTYQKEKDANSNSGKWREPLLSIVSYNRDLMQAKLQDEATVKFFEETYAVAAKEGIKNHLIGVPTLDTWKAYPDLLGSGSMWKEMAAKIILGEQPIDTFDEFVKNWAAQGGDEIIEETNQWYNEHNGQ